MFKTLQPHASGQPSPGRLLPVIPSTWRWARLASCGSQVRESGRPDLPLLSVYLGRGVIPYAEGGRRVHAPSERLDNYQVVAPGDLVMNNQQAWRGSVGVSAHYGIISPAYLIWRLSHEISPDYARHLFPAGVMVDQFVTASRGVGDIQRDLHTPSLRNVLVPIPPPEDQAAIVRYLAHANARINKVISAKRRLVQLLTEQWLAEDDLDLHQTPDSMEPVRLKYVVREVDERSPAGLERHLSMSQRLGLVPAEEVQRTLTAESMANGRLCRKGDIVLNRLKAHLGVFSVAPMDGVVSPDYTILRVTADVDPHYLCAKLRSRSMRPELRRRTKGIVEGFWRLYTPDLLSMEVLLPGRSSQAQVVDRMNGRAAANEQLRARIEREVSLLEEFRARLVADVVSGQVDIRVAAAGLSDFDVAVPGVDAADSEDELEIDDVMEMSEV